MLKRSLLLSMLLSLSSSAQELEDIFKEGKVSGQLIRAFWYDGDRELRIDRTALTLGGILSYKTASYEGFSGGVSFFSSNGVTSLALYGSVIETIQSYNITMR
jgi:imipenem/basic amino acid-specific outer membrane pore